MAKKRAIGNIKFLDNDKAILRVSAGFDDFGRRIQRSKTVEVSSETDAERKLIAFYNQVQKERANIVENDSPNTLGELYKIFDSDHISGLRSSTQDFYHRMWDKYLVPYSKARLNSLNAKRIKTILKNCPAPARDKRAVYGLLNTMFRFATAEDNNYMANNPCASVTPPKYKPKEKKVLSVDEAKRIVDLISAESYERQLSFVLASICAMRRGEVMALKYSDVDIKNRLIHINSAAARSKDRGEYVDRPKNEKSVRSLRLPIQAVHLIIALKMQQDVRREQLGNKWHENDYIFKAWNGERLGVEFPTHWWREFRQKHNIAKDVTFHGLRHTAATYMLIQNIPVTTVSGILGHSQISTTMNIYSHVIENSDAGITSLEKLYSGSKK